MSRQINLFDPALRPVRPLLGATTLLAIAVLIGALLLGYGQYSKGQLAADQARRDETATQLAALKERTRQLGAGGARAADKALQEELARAEARAKNWQDLLARLGGAGIGNTRGHAKFLEALARQHAEGVWLTRITAGDTEGTFEFALQGRVVRPELLSGYIQMLSREEALRGQSIGEMKVSRKVEPAPGEAKKDTTARTPDIDYVEFTLASAPTASTAPVTAAAPGERR